MYTMGSLFCPKLSMKVLGLLFIIIGLIVFGTIITDQFNAGRDSMDASLEHISDCSKFTEFECIAKSGCSPTYEENTVRALTQGLPTRTQ